jgi:PhnB protein
MEMDTNRSNAGVTGQYTTNGMPNGYSAITPFIVVSDPAEAIRFYETVFGAKAKSVTDIGNDGKKIIIHADIDFGHGFLQLGAANPAYRLVLPPGEGDVCYSLGIYVSGDRYCSVLDPFGIRWSIMTRIEDISEEESYRRVADWSKGLGQ